MDELAAAPSDSRWIYGKGTQTEEDITDRRGKGGMERQESEGTRKKRGNLRKEGGGRGPPRADVSNMRQTEAIVVTHIGGGMKCQSSVSHLSLYTDMFYVPNMLNFWRTQS